MGPKFGEGLLGVEAPDEEDKASLDGLGDRGTGNSNRACSASGSRSMASASASVWCFVQSELCCPCRFTAVLAEEETERVCFASPASESSAVSFIAVGENASLRKIGPCWAWKLIIGGVNASASCSSSSSSASSAGSGTVESESSSPLLSARNGAM